MTTKTDRQNILRKVRALLDKAESTTFSAERDAFLNKADELMMRHAVAEHELVMEGKAKDVKPEVRTFDVCRADNPLKDSLVDLIASISQYTRGRIVFYGLRDGRASATPIRAKVVAYPSDLDYIELLHTSLNLQLANEMEPKPEASKSLFENMSALKATGAKWSRVFELLEVRDPSETADYTKEERRLIGQWRKWLAETGQEELKGIHPKSYRRSYAEGFVVEVRERFAKLAQERKEREARDRGETTGSTALVLADRSKVVDRAFHEMFPNLTNGPARQGGKLNPAGFRRGREAGARADLSRPGSGLRSTPKLGGGS